MADEKPDEAEVAVREHVRMLLAQISALQARLRAQDQAGQSGSQNAVEIDRENDSPGRINGADRPA